MHNLVTKLNVSAGVRPATYLFPGHGAGMYIPIVAGTTQADAKSWLAVNFS